MGTPTIKTRVAMDGEKEYKESLATINASLRELKSEMSLAKTKFEDTGDSVEALSAKNDILERSILSQKEKLETLRGALANSAQIYGETDTKTIAWKSSINRAEEALIKMERELEANKKALEEAAAAAEINEAAIEDVSNAADKSVRPMRDMADAVDDTSDTSGKAKSSLDLFDLGLQRAEDGSVDLNGTLSNLVDKLKDNLPSGADKAVEALGKINTKGAGVVAIIVALVKALADAAKKLAEITIESANYAASLSALSQTTGLSVEAAQKWDYALGTVGSSLEDAQGDLSALQEKMVEAANGSGEASEIFSELGVSVETSSGKLRSTEDVLWDLVGALADMDDVTRRNADSSALLGGTGEKLIPFYNDSRDALERLMEKKEDFGILTDEEIEKLSKVKTALYDYDEAMKTVKDNIAEEFGPSLAGFYDDITKGIEELGDASKDSGLVAFFASLVELVAALAPLLDVLALIIDGLSPIFYVLGVVIAAVSDALSILLNLVVGAIEVFASWFAGGDPETAGVDNFETIKEIMSGRDSALARIGGDTFSEPMKMWESYFYGSENAPTPQESWDSEAYRQWETEQYGYSYIPVKPAIMDPSKTETPTTPTVTENYYFNVDASKVHDFVAFVEMAKNARRYGRMKKEPVQEVTTN